jgi:hypothetical protein
MNSEKPLVSIIITCYNDADYVEEAISSAVEQSYENKEVIVVDDGSGEKTKLILRKNENKINRLIFQENKGLSAARNTGIRASRGKYIVVLDGDDYFEPTFCEKAIEFVRSSRRQAKIVTCQARRFNREGTIDVFTPAGGGLENFLFQNSAVGNALFAKEDWKKVGGYDEKMDQGYEDWEFYLRLLIQGGEAVVVPEPLFNYRQKHDSMRIRANKIRYELWEYIFFKHEKLYRENFAPLVLHFIRKLKEEEREKIKNRNRLEFKIGKNLLAPVRVMKSIIKW